jgi:hypothetical protein
MIIIICKIRLKESNNLICFYNIKMEYRKFYCFTYPSFVVIVVVFVDVNPNATIFPPLLDWRYKEEPVTETKNYCRR